MPTAPATPSAAAVHGTLYLLPRTSVRGDAIIPLSQMRARFPDLYELNIRKYAARPSIMDSPIEPLGCTWSDVVFLAPCTRHPYSRHCAPLVAKAASSADPRGHGPWTPRAWTPPAQ